MHIAIATSAAMPGGFDDADLARALLEAGADRALSVVWDDPGAEWHRFDRVVVRSVWDYTFRREEFLAWADGVGPAVLRNEPAVLRWNSDKRYLADLAATGLPVVATSYVAPGDPAPAFEGEVVVKPTVSAGARDTGRFGPATHSAARALIARLGARGATAMVQPYLPAVDDRGETAIVMFAGAVSHVLRKRAVLRPDEEAPLAEGDIGAALVMFEEDLVTAGEASDAELALAERVVGAVTERFGSVPLIARVDLLSDAAGEPVLLELEAIEPALYFAQAPGAAARLARAALSDLMPARS